MTEERLKALAAEALFKHQTTSMFTLMADCEYVVDAATRDMPEITRETRAQMVAPCLGADKRSRHPKSRIEEKVAEYESITRKAIMWIGILITRLKKTL